MPEASLVSQGVAQGPEQPHPVRGGCGPWAFFMGGNGRDLVGRGASRGGKREAQEGARGAVESEEALQEARW
ncbi:MAG: hypothetical protein RLZZ117_2709 [Cyanobacteriota bacterium]